LENVFVEDAFGEDVEEGDEEDLDDYDDYEGDEEAGFKESKFKYTDDIEDFESMGKATQGSSKKNYLNKKRGRDKRNIEYEYEEEYDNKLKH
jgi:hypothetical protein